MRMETIDPKTRFDERLEHTMIPETIKELRGSRDQRVCDPGREMPHNSTLVLDYTSALYRAWAIADESRIVRKRIPTKPGERHRMSVKFVISLESMSEDEGDRVLCDIWAHLIEAFSLGQFDTTDIADDNGKLQRALRDLGRIWSNLACDPGFRESKFFRMHAVNSIISTREHDTPRVALLSAGREILMGDRACELEQAVAAYCDGVPVDDIIA